MTLLAFCLTILLCSGYAWTDEGSLKWAFETGGGVVSSPAIGPDGTIYLGSNDGSLYAINPDGTLKWTFPTKGAVHSRPAIGPDGTIYVGSWDHYLYAINPDGSSKWAFLTKGKINSSPFIDPDGTIYVGSWDHHLYAINQDGSLKWAFSTKETVLSSPAVGPDGTVYVASWDHYLYAINGSSVETPEAQKTAFEEKEEEEVQLAGTEIVREIKGIRVEVTPGGEEKVIFLLGDFSPPKFFAFEGDRPRLVCDFFDARLAGEIDHRIKVDGTLIRQIRIALHRGSRPKVRVVLDLVPKQNYDVEQIFFKDENIYTIIVSPAIQ